MVHYVGELALVACPHLRGKCANLPACWSKGAVRTGRWVEGHSNPAGSAAANKGINLDHQGILNLSILEHNINALPDPRFDPAAAAYMAAALLDIFLT